MTEWQHVPVLYREILDFLQVGDRPAKLIDGTLGNGGHSKLLLQKCPNLRILGIDRDDQALRRAAANLAQFSDRTTLVRGEFADLAALAKANDFTNADAILLDIGVSSPQLDDPARGFSWRSDGPLDMRMDRRSPLTASRLLNHSDEDELTKIFRNYGELPQARLLARSIVNQRAQKLFENTADLVKICDDVLGRGRKHSSLPNPTLPFQALRIAVNDELGELERALPAALATLKGGGRLAVISFHSLEDRIVKHFFIDKARGCICPPDFPICICHHQPELTILTKKAMTAQPDEQEQNPRSCCAKLRVIQKADLTDIQQGRTCL